MPVISLQKFADLHDTNKTAVYRAAKTLKIATSKGLDDDAQALIREHLELSPPVVEAVTAIVPKVETEMVSASVPGYQIPQAENVDLTISDSGADVYRSQQSVTQSQTQRLINEMIANAAAQGVEDRLEAEAIADSLKAAFVNARTAAFATPPANNVQVGQPKAESFQSGNTRGM